MRLQTRTPDPAAVWLRPLHPAAGHRLHLCASPPGLVLLVNANPLEAYYYFLVDPLSSRVSAIEVLVEVDAAAADRRGRDLCLCRRLLEHRRRGAAADGRDRGHGHRPADAWRARLAGHPLDDRGRLCWPGMVWALVPALMKVKLAIDEVVTTLLLNSVALLVVSALLNGPWRDPISQWPQSPEIAAVRHLPQADPALPAASGLSFWRCSSS